MKLWFKRGLLALLFYCLFLLVSAPAALLRPALNHWLPQIQVNSLEGSLWNGSASPAVLRIDQTALYLGKINWQLEPLSLLTLKPRLHIQSLADSHRLDATLQLASGGVLRLENSTANFPVSLLEPWLPLLVSGDVVIQISELALSQEAIKAADGLLLFSNVVWLAGPRPAGIGDYQAQLKRLDDNTVQLDIADLGARLGLQGELQAELNGRYQFQALLRPTPQLASELRQSLQLFYPLNNRGESRIKLRGQWR